MRNEERDKFLTKAMGYMWAENPRLNIRLDFSTWEVFGLMWTRANKSEWWKEFVGVYNGSDDADLGLLIECSMIHPERFSNALYAFLKGKEKK